MQVASYYIKLDQQNKIKCVLCPHECVINEGKHGICRVRKNNNGRLETLVYAKPAAIHFDPIEKKPLYHFYPGSTILSIGTHGCNMQCFFCQNCEISQTFPVEHSITSKSPAEIISMAESRTGNIGVSYTYNEPTVFFEYMLDISKIASEKGLKNVMISNGYINQKPLAELLEFIDAFNIDLKAFDNAFYSKHTYSSLDPVLGTIKAIVSSGKHLEITHLIIPGLNDELKLFREMVEWIKNETGENTVLHLSRYFPRYKSKIPPTPAETLIRMLEIAKEYLNFVFVGNVDNATGKNTLCPACNSVLIERNGYSTTISGLDNKGKCNSCQKSVIQYI